MKIVKAIQHRPIIIGVEEHTGWLPAGAAKPLPKPIRHLLIDLEIQFDGSGYLLCYSSPDEAFFGDTRYESLVEAESAATECFGIESSEWCTPDKNFDCETSVEINDELRRHSK